MVVMDMAVMDMAVMDMVGMVTDMDMVVMDMAGMVTATRIGTIIGTTATGTVTVVIGAVVGTDMEWAPAGDGRLGVTFGFATEHHLRIRKGVGSVGALFALSAMCNSRR